MAYSVKYSWHEPVGSFSTKKAAQEYARQMREANRQAGNKGPVRVVKNPVKRKKGKPAAKRISRALSGWLKKQNPAMKKASSVRVQKLKGGAIKITPNPPSQYYLQYYDDSDSMGSAFWRHAATVYADSLSDAKRQLKDSIDYYKGFKRRIRRAK